MKKNQVNAILVDQAKRRKNILIYIYAITVVFLISCLFLLLYLNGNKNYYVNYNESGKIDYKVYLEDNDFFNESYLGANNQYIASLIDYITANFNYKLSMAEQNINFKYSYRIEAVVDVKEEGTTNSLYNFSETIHESEEKNGSENVIISEDVTIDYNKYNNIIKRFVSAYELEDTESNLTINMYVNAIGSCEEFDETTSNESIMTLTIPLTTKTIGIDISNNMINTNDNILVCKKNNENTYLFLILSIIFFIFDVVLIVKLIKYEVKTRSAETIYERELKKILNNYRSYIQKINNNIDLKKYQVLKVGSFNEILEIRDTIQQPILMVENDEKNGVYFVIPSNTKVLYVYGLKVSEIHKQMKKNTDNINFLK